MMKTLDKDFYKIQVQRKSHFDEIRFLKMVLGPRYFNRHCLLPWNFNSQLNTSIFWCWKFHILDNQFYFCLCLEETKVFICNCLRVMKFRLSIVFFWNFRSGFFQTSFYHLRVFASLTILFQTGLSFPNLPQSGFPSC